jgi:hypothetical protein
VTFGDAIFTLYESPEAEANGYETYEDALKWAKSVGDLVPCVVTNTSAYVAVPAKSHGNSNDDGEFSEIILGFVVAAVGLGCIIAVSILVLIVVLYAVKAWKKRKAQVIV